MGVEHFGHFKMKLNQGVSNKNFPEAFIYICIKLYLGKCNVYIHSILPNLYVYEVGLNTLNNPVH